MLVVLVIIDAAYAAAQDFFDPSSEFGPYVHEATLPARGLVTSVGGAVLTADGSTVVVFERDREMDAWREFPLGPGDDALNFGRILHFDGATAIVGAEGAVYLFGRDHEAWRQVAKLVPSDGAAEFGRALAFDGRTVVVGAQDRAYVFAGDGNAWHERARLVSSTSVAQFGRAVAVEGRTVLVGAQGTAYLFGRRRGEWREIAALVPSDGDPGFGVSVDLVEEQAVVVAQATTPQTGAVYIFTADPDNPQAWREAARLAPVAGGTPSIPAGTFGGGGLFTPESAFVFARIGPEHGAFYLFERHHGGADNWGLVKRLPEEANGFQFGGLSIGPPDTLMITAGEIFGVANVFARNRGGPNAWGLVATHESVPASSGAFDGQRAMLAARFVTDVRVLARNEARSEGWGVISRVVPRTPALRPAARLDGDTVLIEIQRPGFSAILVLASDVDRDGLRDGRDPCPRDPLNGVVGRCQRASAQHPILDHLIAQGDVTSGTQGRRHFVTATFTNTSNTAVQNPFFEVTELTGRSVLVNADEGRGGVGATLSPDVGDGIFDPGESVTVVFEIRLRRSGPFRFEVRFHGDPFP